MNVKNINFLEGNIYSYIHNSVTDGMGKIGVLLNFNNVVVDGNPQ